MPACLFHVEFWFFLGDFDVLFVICRCDLMWEGPDLEVVSLFVLALKEQGARCYGAEHRSWGCCIIGIGWWEFG